MKKNLLTILLLFIFSIPSAVFGNSIESFENDYAIIQKDNKKGLIDITTGDLVIAPNWTDIIGFIN